MTPSVGRIVHYVSYGTPGGEFTSTCRAAVVTEVGPLEGQVGLAVLNPTGIFLNRGLAYDEAATIGGSWHWPERVE